MNPTTLSEFHSRLRGVFERAGYRRYKMSKFEEYDLYAGNKDFLVSENVLTFTDLDGRLMALKPDVTLSIVKNCGYENGVEKVYYHENVYRAESGGTGFREISQAGLECIGDIDEYCVCEVLSLAAKSLLSIGPDCELDVSHLGLLNELFTAAGLSEASKKEARRLIGEKNLGELSYLLKCENIGEDYSERIIRIASLDDEAAEAVPKLRALFGGCVSEDTLDLFCETCEFLSEEFPKTVRVDFSAQGDPSYYSGIYFKGFADGVPSSVLSGGQYGGLMKKLRKNAKAIGFALYLDLLEPLFEKADSFDADFLLLYDESSSPKEIYRAAEKLSQNGSVCTMKSKPLGMRFYKTYRLVGGALSIEE